MKSPLLLLGVEQLDVHVLRAVRARHLPRHPGDEAVLLRCLVHPVEERERLGYVLHKSSVCSVDNRFFLQN